MPSLEPERISVIRNDQLVPLLPLAGMLDAGRVQPWRGIRLERHRTGTMEIPKHEHKDVCVHLQLSGSVKMEWWSEGRNGLEATRPGSVVLLGAGTQDRLRWEGTSERLILSVAPGFLEQAAEEMGGVRRVEFTNRWAMQDGALQHVMLEMGRESEAGWPLGGLYADVLGMSLAEVLLRRHAAGAMAEMQVRCGLSLGQVRRVMEYVTEHVDREVRIGEMAAQLGMTSFHFARVFRRSVGTSPYQYVLEQRLRRAQGMLRTSSVAVQGVAAVTGWSSAATFVRAFRKRFGVTPQVWRKG